MTSSFVFDFSKWKPVDVAGLCDAEYDALRAQFESFLWTVPAEVLRNWTEEFEVEMKWAAGKFDRMCQDHWVRGKK